MQFFEDSVRLTWISLNLQAIWRTTGLNKSELAELCAHATLACWNVQECCAHATSTWWNYSIFMHMPPTNPREDGLFCVQLSFISWNLRELEEFLRRNSEHVCAQLTSKCWNLQQFVHIHPAKTGTHSSAVHT